MYRIPRYKIQLVREGSQASEVKKVSSPEAATPLIQSYLEGADRENFIVLLLDTKNQLIGINTVTTGTLNSSIVHPREVFKPAVLANAAAVILAHNHPSGNPNPSPEDIAITNRLVEAGKILGIEVLDHVIVGEIHAYSFKGSKMIF